MNCLITGANGFVGSELIKKLYVDGNKLTLLVRDHCSKKIQNEYKNANVYSVNSYSKTDLSCKDHESIFSNIDHVFHLAGMKGVSITNRKVKESIDVNICGLLNLLDLSKSFNIKSIIGLSSEKSVKKTGVYGVSKFLMEKLFEQYRNENKNILYKIVRCGNIAYSPNSLLTIWRDSLLNGEDVVISDPDSTKFLCSVSDAAQFLIDSINIDDPIFVPKIKSIKLGVLLSKMIEKYDPSKRCKIITTGLFKDEDVCEFLDNNYSSDDADKFSDIEIDSII